MATELIEKLISKEAIDSFTTLKNLVDDNVQSFEKLIATGVKLNNDLGKADTFAKMNKGTDALQANEEALLKQIDELRKSNEKLNKLYDDQAKKLEALAKANKPKGSGGGNDTKKVELAQQKLNDLYTAEARELANINEVKKLVNAANRQSAKETLGLVDAYTQLDNEYKKTAREAQNLAIQFGANSEEAREASARTLELYNRLLAADAAVGKFNRNVGNYSGALGVLEDALKEVKAKIDAYNKSADKSADVVEALAKEEKLLTSLLETQVAGFEKATQEVKANTVALQQMALAGLEGSKAYKELFNETAALKEEVGDLSEALKNAEPGEIAFNAAADAARGLIGLYGLAQSATVAFGIENEAFEKTLLKLQAAETALQSIEAIRALFKKESAFQQALQIGLDKIAIFQTNLLTAAESKNIIVKYAAIAAQKALNAVMALGTGPLGAILLILGLLVIALSSFASANDKATKSMEQLNHEYELGETLLNDRVQRIRNNTNEEVSILEAGFASAKKIREERLKGQQEELREVTRFAVENQQNYQRAYDRAQVLLMRQKQGKKLDDDQKEELKQNVDYVNKYIANRNAQSDLESQIYVTIKNNRKADIEEEAEDNRTSIENAILYAQQRKAVFEQQAGDETKSFEQRLEAQRKANEEELKIINQTRQAARSKPGLTPAEISAIEAQAATARIAARREGQNKLDALTKEQRNRERQAQYEIARIGIEVQAEAYKEIADNENKALEDRGMALYQYYKAQETLIEGNKNNELNNASLTATERKKIEEQANAELLALRGQFLKDSNALILASLDDENADRISRQNKANDEAIIKLNDRFKSGSISASKYYKEREKLLVDFTQKALQTEIDNLKKVADEYKKQGKDITQIEEQIAAKQRELSDLTTQKKIDDIAKVKAAQMQLGEEIFGLFTDLVTAGYEKEKNAVQEQIDLNEEKKQKDIEIAQQTITDKEKQAAEIQIIEARAAAEREALEKKQRDLDVKKARFDKQVSISKIILDTARAVIAALTSTPPNVPLSIYTGAIGAVSLARAIATPIPQYKTGTEDATGGMSLLGDGYRREWVVTPSGNIFSTPAVPTIMNIPAHSVVHASDKEAMEAGIFNDLNNAPVLVDNRSHYKYMVEKLGGKFDILTKEVKRGNKIRSKQAKAGWQTMKNRKNI